MSTLDDAAAPAIAPPIRDYLEGLNVALSAKLWSPESAMTQLQRPY